MAASVAFLAACEPEPSDVNEPAGADLILTNACVCTLELRGEATRVVDLAGATVIPGLVDSHTHVFGLGRSASAPGTAQTDIH